jgi:hypothetical protein
MEIMNINAAIRMLDNHTNVLAGIRQMILLTNDRIIGDPDIAEHINSLQNTFKEKLRDATINVIVLQREMTRQTPLLLNFPGELAKLIQSLKTLENELNQSSEAASHIERTAALAASTQIG